MRREGGEGRPCPWHCRSIRIARAVENGAGGDLTVRVSLAHQPTRGGTPISSLLSFPLSYFSPSKGRATIASFHFRSRYLGPFFDDEFHFINIYKYRTIVNKKKTRLNSNYSTIIAILIRSSNFSQQYIITLFFLEKIVSQKNFGEGKHASYTHALALALGRYSSPRWPAAFFRSRTPPPSAAAAFLRRPRGGHVVNGGAHRAGAADRPALAEPTREGGREGGRGGYTPPPPDEVNALEESRLGVA